jgi:prepilin-type N-terminal cleavage/methylation domain-containing protein
MVSLKKVKAFTLIELLVVVAIIGILAAVGVVAYNGYTTSAKNAAIKGQFNMIVKYFTAELQKCNLGSNKIFLEQVNCSSRFTRNPFGRDIEYALKKSFYRISYVDRNGNQKNALRQGSFSSTACSKSPNVFYGDMAYDINDKSNPVTLKITTCDTSGNYFESTIIIE